MAINPLLAGVYDPRRTMAPERARQLVQRALAFLGPVRVVQSGPVTVGLAPRENDSSVLQTDHAVCVSEGRPRLDGAWASDADVAAAWAARGDETLASLRGAFLMLLWNEHRQHGVVARDQMGQRPLLWHAGEFLSFAGEFRPLLSLLNPTPAPDDVAVACWLGSRVPTGGRTFFQGVHRLPPGHLLELEHGRWSSRSYWQPRYRDPVSAPREELLKGLRSQIERATATTLDGVQSPGVLLSGGVDSSTVAAVAAPLTRAAGTTLRAYSAGFPALPTADESARVDELLGAFQLSGTRMAVHGGSLLAGSLAYVRAWGMPDLSANNFFWIDLLGRAAADGVEVLLDGEGGDELFKTPYYLIADRLRAGKLRAARQLLEVFPGIAGKPSRRLRVQLIGIYGLGGMLPHAVDRAWSRRRPHVSPLELLDDPARWARAAGDPTSWKRLEGPRWWAHLAEAMVYGPDGIGGAEHALRVARMAGIERRRPLLDLDLSEHVLRLPPELAFSPWFGKGHVRAAMAGLVPDSVRLQRQKTFFTDVRVRSLVESDMPLARRLLGPEAEVRRYVSAEAIRSALAGPATGASQSERGIWGFRVQHLASTELWLRAQADPGFADKVASEAALDPARFEFQVQGGAFH